MCKCLFRLSTPGIRSAALIGRFLSSDSWFWLFNLAKCPIPAVIPSKSSPSLFTIQKVSQCSSYDKHLDTLSVQYKDSVSPATDDYLGGQFSFILLAASDTLPTDNVGIFNHECMCSAKCTLCSSTEPTITHVDHIWYQEHGKRNT